MSMEQLNATYGIDGHLAFFAGEGGLPMAKITAAGAEALVSIYAGQVLAWRPAGQSEDVFFLSSKAYYAPGKAIKGGVPICWPWFGADPDGKGRPGHGFMRNRQWDVRSGEKTADGRVRFVMGLKESADTLAIWPHAFDLEIEVIVGETLTINLTSRNTDAGPVTISQGLHSYFRVGNIARTQVLGLDGARFIDKVDQSKDKKIWGPVIIEGEVDRVYYGIGNRLGIVDRTLERRIDLTSSGSKSAVVWNPWKAIAASMADLEDDDYQRFVCVETTNASPDTVILDPGASHTIGVVISVEA